MYIEIPERVSMVIILLLSLFLISLFLYEKNEILNIILPRKLKEKINLYITRWISRDFDEYIGNDLLELLEDGYRMINDFNKDKGTLSFPQVSDYSFLILPTAKAYEGILKKILINKGMLKEEGLKNNPNVNVGSFFNPLGNEAVFKILRDKARDKSIPHVIYSTYQECRNQLLHYDLYRDNRVKSIDEARFIYQRIIDAINKVYSTFIKK